MRVVDDAILAMIAAAEVGFPVYDGDFETKRTGTNENVADYPLPYAVYFSNLGDDRGEGNEQRAIGVTSVRSVFLTVAYVGLSRAQAKWAGERIRKALNRKRPVVDGVNKVGLINLQESQRVRRDDEIQRTDGNPVFFGVDEFFVAVHSPTL